jgi:hypothetical protein
MTLAIVLVISAFAALCVILGITVSRGLRVSHQPEIGSQLQPIDIEAFRNLADPAEDTYLRRRLPDSDFRKVQRERLRAMAAYIQLAGRNAAVLIHVAQSALVSNAPDTAEAAQRLLNDALLLRRNAAVALFKIYVTLAWPSSSSSASPILAGYERLSGSAMLLGRLQNPAAPVRISATL